MSPYSYRTYTGDGSKVVFPIPFPFYDPEHIKVFPEALFGVDAPAEEVVFAIAPVGEFRVYRSTPLDIRDDIALRYREEETADALGVSIGDLQANVDTIAKALKVAIGGVEVMSYNHTRAIVAEEASVRIQGDEAIASSIAILDAQVSDPMTGLENAHARITTEATARASADNALSTRTTNLEATVNNATTGVAAAHSRITTEETARANGDSTNATAITTLSSQVNHATTGLPNAHSRITSEESTRASADSTLSSRATSLESRMGTAESGISSLSTTKVDASGAYSQALSAITAKIGDGTVATGASVTTEASARASEDAAIRGKLDARYVLKVAAGNVVTGMTFISATGADGDVSEITFQADKFKVYNGALGITPFSIEGSTVVLGGTNVKVAASEYRHGLFTTKTEDAGFWAGYTTSKWGSTSYATDWTTAIGAVGGLIGGSIITQKQRDSAYEAFSIGSGILKWGGGSAEPDTNLYRNYANELKTDDSFIVGGWCMVGNGLYLGGSDVSLYRAGSDQLKTDDSFSVGSHVTFSVSNGTAAVGNIQIGASKTGNRYAIIDMFADDTYTPGSGNPCFRIIRHNGGANSTTEILHRGTGAFNIGAQDAGTLYLKTSNTNRWVIPSGANELLDANGNKVLTTRRGAISDPGYDLGSVQGAVIAILNMLRPSTGHGLIS